MIALLLAASIALPPGVTGEWQGVEAGQKIVVYNTGVHVTTGTNPDHPDKTFGFLIPIMSATNDPRTFIAGSRPGHYCSLTFEASGTDLTLDCWRNEYDYSGVYRETYRFTREGLSDS